MDENRLKIRQLVETYDAVNIELAITIAEGIGKYHWIKEDYLDVAEWVQSLVHNRPKWLVGQTDEENEPVVRIQALNSNWGKALTFKKIPSAPPKRFLALVQPKKVQFLDIKASEIPDYIFEWKSVNNLFLSACSFEKIPPTIGQLHQLKYIGLTKNIFQELPDELGRLKDLRSLRCQNNQLTKLPNTLADLSKLHTIDCDNNPFTQVPKVLFKMPKLRQLWIAGTNIPESELQILKATLPARCRISWTHAESDKLPF